MKVRSGNYRDLPFLREMLFEAVFWNPGTGRPDPEDFLRKPEIMKLTSGWGRHGDLLLIAEEAGEDIGAAWYRLWTEENHSYGFVNSEIPELGIAIIPQVRSRGYGRLLLKNLISNAADQEFPGLSLSVDPSNPARRLYESEGFFKVGESGTSWTYVQRFRNVRSVTPG